MYLNSVQHQLEACAKRQTKHIQVTTVKVCACIPPVRCLECSQPQHAPFHADLLSGGAYCPWFQYSTNLELADSLALQAIYPFAPQVSYSFLILNS